MKIDSKDLLNSILESLDHLNYIPLDEIPNIDLYMDQVTTFMEKGLSPTKRYEEDKILTKTMINNYAKNNLLPPPLKKKYSREHMIVLIFIYYFKNILSIQDIEQLLKPITDAGISTQMHLLQDTTRSCRICTSRTAPCAKARFERSSKKIFLLPETSEETFSEMLRMNTGEELKRLSGISSAA